MEERLKQILDTMDIPEARKSLSVHNLKWLTRNIDVRNKDHADIKEAWTLILALLKR